MILVFFVSLYFSEFIAKTYIFRDLSSYRPCQEHLIIIAIILIVVAVVVMAVIFLKYLFFLTQLKMVLIMRYIIIIVLLLLFGWLVVCITTEKANKIGQEWNLQKENSIF